MAAMVVRSADQCVVAGGKDGLGVAADGSSTSAVAALAIARPLVLDKSAAVAALALGGFAEGTLVSATNKTIRLWDLGRFR
jgi:hypothetical protein